MYKEPSSCQSSLAPSFLLPPPAATHIHFLLLTTLRNMNSAIQLSLSWLIHNILLAFASLPFLYTLLHVIHNLLFSPLSAIPGPWYAAVSDLWLKSHVLRLQQYKTIQKLFQVYGPVVCVGPNKVVFRDLTSMRSVYSVHKFDKSTYYKSLPMYVAKPSSGICAVG
jgi:hypothetical protein